MIPAERYQPKKINNDSRNDDMMFTTFKTNFNMKINNPLLGWIPIYFYPNNMNMPPLNIIPQLPGNNLNIAPDNTNMDLNNNDDDILYSYNKDSSKQNNNSSSSSMDSMNIGYYNNNTPFYSNTLNNPPRILDCLKDFDLNIDRDIDALRNDSDDYIEEIFNNIEQNNPKTFNLLKAYNVPYPIQKLLIKRIISLTIDYNSNNKEDLNA